MRIFSVSEIVDLKATGVQQSPRFNWPFREFFHGADRPVANIFGKRPYKPLPLIRNVRLMPQVFFPSVRMVAGRGVAEGLARFDGVDLNNCTWDAIYDLPIDEASMLRLRERFSVLGSEYGDWLETQLATPPAAVQLPDYFEIITPAHQQVAAAFQCLDAIDLPSPAYERLPTIHTCAKLHELYPVVTVLPHYLFSEESWPVVQPHVNDLDLFTVRSFELKR